VLSLAFFQLLPQPARRFMLPDVALTFSGRLGRVLLQRRHLTRFQVLDLCLLLCPAIYDVVLPLLILASSEGRRGALSDNLSFGRAPREEEIADRVRNTVRPRSADVPTGPFARAP
jgi:hypothetical protein